MLRKSFVPGIVQWSPFRNSYVVTVGSWSAGLAAGGLSAIGIVFRVQW